MSKWSYDAIYLKPLTNPRINQWYSRVVLGHNVLSTVVLSLCKQAGIVGHRTNHSLCATAATRLFQQGVDEQLIMDNTGYRSVQGVWSYKRTSSEQQRIVSEMLCGLVSSLTSSTSSIEMTHLQAMKDITLNNCSDVHINIHSSHSS